jgi:hypothetical protein
MVIFLINLSGFILSIMRLFELGDCLRIFFSNSKEQSTKESFNLQDQSMNSSEINLDIEKENNYEVFNDKSSISVSLSNSFLVEYMFYIIFGVLQISKLSDESKNPYMIT